MLDDSRISKAGIVILTAEQLCLGCSPVSEGLSRLLCPDYILDLLSFVDNRRSGCVILAAQL